MKNKKRHKTFLKIILILFFVLLIAYFIIGYRSKPEQIQYGVSFNAPYVAELGLDSREVFDATLDDLGVRNFRLAAHWNAVEPQNNQWNFDEIDYQMQRAKETNSKVIMAIGRRLPRWPECHIPQWAWGMTWEDQQGEILEYLKKVVERYKGYDNIIYWQVENEPFLDIFAREHCGKLDVDFLDKEIAFVKDLDSSRPILVTDSGNLGTWVGAFKRGDLFGTSVYVYLWNPDLGPFKSILPASFYRFKSGIINLIFGPKETLLIELSLEPWLLQPVVDTPFDVQFERMDIDKFNNIIKFAQKTRFEKQYLWGVEWWYYLKENGNPEFWQRAKEIFRQNKK